MKKLKSRGHVKWTLCTRQKKNVKTLLRYLKGGDLKAGFTMYQFDDDYNDRATVCGSAGCIIGHGPHAGIPKSADETWDEYGKLNFGSHSVEDSWKFIFSGLWSYTDNSLSGAVYRLEYALKFGIPQADDDEREWIDMYIENVQNELNP